MPLYPNTKSPGGECSLKRTLFVVPAMLLSVVVSSAAWAQDSDRSFYAGGFGGLNLASDRDGSSEDGTITTFTELSAGFAAGGFFGYRVHTTGNVGVRIEGEVAFRTNDVESFSIFGTEPMVNDDAMFTTTAGMGNVLVDFLATGAVTPYAGAGIGVADVYQDLRYGPVDQKNRGTTFAWQLIGGIAGAISDRLDVFGDVRYFATGDADIDRETPAGTTPIQLRAEDVTIQGGVRINF